MATFVFDTHRAVKDLEEAGFPEAQAEALVEIVGAAVGENAATKADLDAMEQRMTARFDAKFDTFERRMEAQFDALGRRMGDRFGAFGHRMGDRFDAFEQRMDARFDAFERRITIRLIAIILPSFGLFFAAMRFFS